MLTIENFKKIKNQWFGDWQIGKGIMEEKTHYALQSQHSSGKRSVTIVIFREPKMDDNLEMYYTISLIDDFKGSSSIIEDVIYHSVLEDMELFGESLVHYLNTI
jgi:hypothetical protein